MPHPIERLVTGHAAGRSVLHSRGPVPTVLDIAALPGTRFHEIWNTAGAPACIDNGGDPTLGPLQLQPPPGGSRLRIVDIPPDLLALRGLDPAQLQQLFLQMAGPAVASPPGAPHPLMHRTETIDYAVVLEGEITLVLDDGEHHLQSGSVVVQRGTSHAWSNRSERNCRMLFVLLDGRYAPYLTAAPDAPPTQAA